MLIKLFFQNQLFHLKIVLLIFLFLKFIRILISKFIQIIVCLFKLKINYYIVSFYIKMIKNLQLKIKQQKMSLLQILFKENLQLNVKLLKIQKEAFLLKKKFLFNKMILKLNLQKIQQTNQKMQNGQFQWKQSKFNKNITRYKKDKLVQIIQTKNNQKKCAKKQKSFTKK
ncbi:hypothetical protein IMG5_154710 [Ichthyophthirius multifiliis]|uniref:Transmembrane protein n=1 Tax=Ichthyophthirius multifiliis TaxID=5932 RepID=G0QZ65_ICHMU|nr:hypothetical protein IMG5_154710 [Ichthyophthirius multifiliis]EGR29488.1 hypothetical protein IMG5_154710 [Ichthyophthirius multifiliis]|eukprot:XP_004030724.1 hypothetical protein IMG5_154710 [Ichthyophthirius multifiliis]